MITEHDLAEAIAECEGQRNPTSSTCMKLAAFYTIRDKMFPVKHEPIFYSTKSEERKTENVIELKSEIDSEFKQAVNDMNIEEVISVMDELMATIKIISPRLYSGVMRKLTQ